MPDISEKKFNLVYIMFLINALGRDKDQIKDLEKSIEILSGEKDMFKKFCDLDILYFNKDEKVTANSEWLNRIYLMKKWSTSLNMLMQD